MKFKVDEKFKQNYLLSDKLVNLFNCCDIPLYLHYENIYKEYNQFDVSEKNGMIKMHNTSTNKSVTIKVGRFLTNYYKDINKFLNKKITINIENTHNLFIMYQSDKNMIVEELYGNDIKQAYNSLNHIKNHYTLQTSCMNNKLGFLSLYTNNPKSVRVMVIKTNDKILGRCLIWTTTCGVEIMDKRYVCNDWVEQKFKKIVKERGFLDVHGNSLDKYKIEIDIDKTGIKFDNMLLLNYPYLDTFMHLYDDRIMMQILPNFIIKIYNKIYKRPNIKVLSSKKPRGKNFISLRSTTGNWMDSDGYIR